jgi:glutathione synthase/RimK-type ligase-like ATP-grasp enzyme
LEALPVMPVILQNYVEKRIELRITVVGERVFACAIHSQEGDAATRVDWRNDIGALRHESFTLPPEIEEKCVALVRDLGLEFSAIDMIVTPDGEYVFLESNACGQWLWLERRAGLPIAGTLADLLTSGTHGGHFHSSTAREQGISRPLGADDRHGRSATH